MTSNPENRRDAVLRDFYAAINAKNWQRATGFLAPACRWHVLANDVVDSGLLLGADAVRAWFETALGSVQTRQTITKIVSSDGASAVFTEPAADRPCDSSTSGWIEVFRFEGDLIAEHVSLRSG
jgi:predicted SnoaL-like aldol condensation-catalyzing enzyme